MALYSPRFVLRLGTSKTLIFFSLIRSQRRSLASPVSRLRSVLTATAIAKAEIILDVQLLKEQNKYDRIPLSIFDRLQRIEPLVKKATDEIVCEETDILEKILPRMFKVMHRVAEYSCGYVKRGRLGGYRLSRFRIC